ncbi:MAG TPA: DUF2784 domain-containing protein [Candidatus Binataceae bacterium]|nr:DUF2784 domain-containing protein [Candidatus Binataceae bacterium]
MRWLVLADTVAIVHAAYIAFVVLGLALIVVGASAGAGWARNFTLRTIHLCAILVVCAEVITGIRCPLTMLENVLRIRAGAAAYQNDFIGYWVDRLIFYDFPPWVFALLYFGFASLVVLSWWRWPPRRPNWARMAKHASERPGA